MLMPMMLAAALVQQAAPAAGVEPLRTDAKGRPMVSATIDGKAPVDVVIDTAAGSTVMTDAAARGLGLKPSGGSVAVAGVAGGQAAPLYRVASFANRLFDLRDAEIPGLSTIGRTEAQVIAGVDLFEGRRLVIDTIRHEARVEGSGPTPAGFVAVRGTYSPGDGLLIPMTINGVEVQGLIDTGAEGSVAGGDLRRALGWERDDARLAPYGQIRGAAGGGSDARVATIDSLKIGPVSAGGVPIVFVEGLAPRAATGGKPLVIVGLNLLNALQVYALDFPRGELQLRKAPPPARR